MSTRKNHRGGLKEFVLLLRINEEDELLSVEEEDKLRVLSRRSHAEGAQKRWARHELEELDGDGPKLKLELDEKGHKMNELGRLSALFGGRKIFKVERRMHCHCWTT